MVFIAVICRCAGFKTMNRCLACYLLGSAFNETDNTVQPHKYAAIRACRNALHEGVLESDVEAKEMS
jgi:hypothetical protein